MSDQKIKKKPSGAEYRKRKREQEKEFHKAKKFMNIDKYIAKKSQEELESISENPALLHLSERKKTRTKKMIRPRLNPKSLMKTIVLAT